MQPRAPTPIEPGGTYPHSPSPEPPLYREKDIQGYTPYLGHWLPLAITKKHPFFLVFSGNLPETTAKKYPLPEKMGTRMRPLCIRVGWGEGVGMQHEDYALVSAESGLHLGGGELGGRV